MKRALVLIFMLFVCNLLFAKVEWLDVEEMGFDKDSFLYPSAVATCETEEEVLKITHWKNLEDNFKTYLTEKEPADKNYYVVMFTNLAVLVYEVNKGSKVYRYYFKIN